MMIFTSIYGVVDGFFVSNYVGKTAFASVNFIMPFLMILGALGSMIGSGGSALIAKTLGEKNNDKANQIFSLMVYISIISGTIIAVLAIIFIRPITAFLGTEGSMLDDCVIYGRVILVALPAFMLQYEFQSFFITAEKPQLGLIVTVASGLTNIILDFLMVGIIPLGLVGAAAATALSQFVGGVVPLIYFARKNTSLLRLGKMKLDSKALLKTCTNGSSEFLSNISMSVVNMLYNVQLIKYAGENGVAAYGVLMYVNMVFIAVFIGYSLGTGPIIGYHFGAQNHKELKSLLKKSLVIIGVSAVSMLLLSELLARPLSKIFVGYNPELFDITLHAFLIFSFSFLFASVPIFCSAFFTSLNDGLVSALISFLRTIVFQVAAVLIFPLFWGLDGIWFSIVAAEIVAAAASVVFLIANKKKYKY